MSITSCSCRALVHQCVVYLKHGFIVQWLAIRAINLEVIGSNPYQDKNILKLSALTSALSDLSCNTLHQEKKSHRTHMYTCVKAEKFTDDLYRSVPTSLQPYGLDLIFSVYTGNPISAPLLEYIMCNAS